METLEVLVKLAERKVQEAEQQLAKVREAILAADQEILRCQTEAQQAFIRATKEEDVMALQAAMGFQERMKQRALQIERDKMVMREHEQQWKDKLHTAFIENKRFDLLLKKQQLAAKKKHDRKVQAQLDDIGQKRD